MAVDDPDDVVVLLPVDNVRRLDHDLLESFPGKFVHRFADVVDHGSVALFQSSDDHLAGESPSDLPIGEAFLHQSL